MSIAAKGRVKVPIITNDFEKSVYSHLLNRQFLKTSEVPEGAQRPDIPEGGLPLSCVVSRVGQTCPTELEHCSPARPAVLSRADRDGASAIRVHKGYIPGSDWCRKKGLLVGPSHGEITRTEHQGERRQPW